MSVLFDPNIAYLLLVLTIFLATLAVLVPGTGLLEIGALAAGVLAGYAALHLSINLWALLALALGLGALIVAVFARRGQWGWLLLSALGLIGGSVFLFRAPERGTAVHPALAFSASALLGAYFWFGVRAGLRAWREKPPVHSLERLIGQIGETRTEVHLEGSVYVDGEMWSARSAQAIPPGRKVRVIGREGLILLVEPVENAPTGEGSPPRAL